jgi:phosphatidyl-myo-inositol alpha-mannosyltransferase
MRIGIVCPYSWDIPGGVSAHVADLAEALIRMGHHVSVLAPAEFDELLAELCGVYGKAESS